MERQRKAAESKASSAPLEKIYQDENEDKPKADLKKINQPKSRKSGEGLIKLMLFILAALAVSAAVYFLFFWHKGAPIDSKNKNWYAITLKDNGMNYYGQVFDIKANPVVINNVYYDYDQNEAIKNNKPFTGAGNLRLVKQGKETYGPDSVTSVYQSNISTIIPLKADSKVLQAILGYEKK